MIHALLILILIFTPIARGAVRIWAFGPVQILTLVALALSALRLFSPRPEEVRIRRTPVDIPILLFLCLCIVTIFNSMYIHGAIMEFTRLVCLAAIFYIVINFMTREEDIKRVLNIVLMASTSIALFGILQYLGIIDRSWWDSSRFLSSTYVNHNHFAGYLELAIPLAIGMSLAEKNMGKRSIYVYSFLILSIAFLLSMSRGGWLSLSLSMTFMAFMIFKRGHSRFVLFMAVLFFVTLGIFIFTAMDLGFLLRRVASYREFDFTGRLEIWKGTINIIKHNWISGTGLGSFMYNFPRYRPPGLNAFINYAHNDYLQVASELGILGLCLMIFIVFKIIRKGLKTHGMAISSFKKWISLSLTAGVLSIAIHGLGDFNLYIPANAILFTVFCGFIFNISSRKEDAYPVIVLRQESIARRFFRPFILTVVTVFIIFISASLLAEICSTLSEKSVSVNDPEKAERLAIIATRYCPINSTYHHKLAGIYDRRGERRRSEKSYKDALRLNPLDSWSWIGLADLYSKIYKDSPMDKNLVTLARSSYEKALELDPSNSYYLKKFAKFLLNTGDPGLASQVYKKALHVISESKTLSQIPVVFTDGKGYQRIADLAFYGQDMHKALIFYKMAEEFSKDDIEPKLGQVRCYARMSLIKEALMKYSQIGDSRKTRSTLFACLGDYYLKKGYEETAKRFSSKAISADAGNPEGHQLRHKISKKVNGYGYLADEVSRILDLNQVALSRNLTPDYFEVGFDLKKRLHNEGNVGLDVILPAGIYEFSVRAKGEKAADIWPHMTVKFNDRIAIDRQVNDALLKDYVGIAIVDYPVNRFEVGYDNDYYNTEKNEDRNLYIEGITLRSLY